MTTKTRKRAGKMSVERNKERRQFAFEFLLKAYEKDPKDPNFNTERAQEALDKKYGHRMQPPVMYALKRLVKAGVKELPADGSLKVPHPKHAPKGTKGPQVPELHSQSRSRTPQESVGGTGPQVGARADNSESMPPPQIQDPIVKGAVDQMLKDLRELGYEVEVPRLRYRPPVREISA